MNRLLASAEVPDLDLFRHVLLFVEPAGSLLTEGQLKRSREEQLLDLIVVGPGDCVPLVRKETAEELLLSAVAVGSTFI